MIGYIAPWREKHMRRITHGDSLLIVEYLGISRSNLYICVSMWRALTRL